MEIKIELKKEIEEDEYIAMLQKCSQTVEKLIITIGFMEWGFIASKTVNPPAIHFPQLRILEVITEPKTSRYDLRIVFKPLTNTNVQQLIVNDLKKEIIDIATEMADLRVIKCSDAKQSILDYFSDLKRNPTVHTNFRINFSKMITDTVDEMVERMLIGLSLGKDENVDEGKKQKRKAEDTAPTQKMSKRKGDSTDEE